MSKDEAEKTFWTTLISSLLFIVFGVVLLFQPHTTITIISRCITAITLFVAIFGLYKYFTRKDKTKKIDINILYSLVALIISVLVFIYPTAIAGLIPIVMGSFMDINALFKIGYLKQLRKNENKDFGVCLLIFIVMMSLGIILILNPLKNVLEMSQSLGVLITFYSVLDIIICYLFKNNIE